MLNTERQQGNLEECRHLKSACVHSCASAEIDLVWQLHTVQQLASFGLTWGKGFEGAVQLA